MLFSFHPRTLFPDALLNPFGRCRPFFAHTHTHTHRLSQTISDFDGHWVNDVSVRDGEAPALFVGDARGVLSGTCAGRMEMRVDNDSHQQKQNISNHRFQPDMYRNIADTRAKAQSTIATYNNEIFQTVSQCLIRYQRNV
jgi:hypothetical protein